MHAFSCMEVRVKETDVEQLPAPGAPPKRAANLNHQEYGGPAQEHDPEASWPQLIEEQPSHTDDGPKNEDSPRELLPALAVVPAGRHRWVFSVHRSSFTVMPAASGGPRCVGPRCGRTASRAARPPRA